MIKKIVWTLAGSDSSGCAGIQADLKTFQHFGMHGCSLITAVTAQNRHQLDKIQYVSADSLLSQIHILQNDMPPDAIKIGMLGNFSIIKKVHRFLQQYSGKVVLDPLMVSSSGKNLFATDLTTYLLKLQTIYPYVDVLTPNLPEAEKIIGRRLITYQDIEKGAEDILALGVKSVFIKGGHFYQDDFSQDYWSNGSVSCWISSKRYPQRNYRGTGCILSSSLAACLALGYDVKDALIIAKMYVLRGIRLAEISNHHSALMAYGGWPEDEVDLPYLNHAPIQQIGKKFSDCGTEVLGLYPIVDSLDWIKRLLPLGVKTIQLRIKHKQGVELENQIQQSIAFAKKYQAKLFINDYWKLAIQYGAYGVHLGQEDINQADIADIRKAGLRLGISTHCYYEVARAHTLRPSYLACGPIFPTTSKIMLFQPQGLAQLKRWRRTLSYPLVAIGGITMEQLPNILATGVDGVAMISAITQAQEPHEMTKALLNKVDQYVAHNR